MKVAAVQHDIEWRDARATCARLAPVIEREAGGGARLILLAEMFATGFDMDASAISEPMDGPTVTFLRESASHHQAWIAGSVAISGERTDDGADRAVNRFIAAGPAGELAHYDKRHPFTYANEHREFAPGDEMVTFEIDGLLVTPLICYDLRFANDFWSRGPGTDLFVVPANWPITRRHHWTSLLTARAIENQCYVAGINRVGSADGLEYGGDSMIIDPAGQTLVSAAQAETVLNADVLSERVEAVRSRFPFLQDRR